MAKYDYCRFGHARPSYMAECPVCSLENVTPLSTVTKSSYGGARTGAGRVRVHTTNAERQAAYRERRGSR